MLKSRRSAEDGCHELLGPRAVRGSAWGGISTDRHESAARPAAADSLTPSRLSYRDGGEQPASSALRRTRGGALRYAVRVVSVLAALAAFAGLEVLRRRQRGGETESRR
jgi:hypothetical protein